MMADWERAYDAWDTALDHIASKEEVFNAGYAAAMARAEQAKALAKELALLADMCPAREYMCSCRRCSTVAKARTAGLLSEAE